MTDALFEEPVSNLLAKADPDQMTDWSEDKKKDFVKLFEDRAKVAKYILQKTAQKIAEVAHRRQFIGAKHWNKLSEEHQIIEGGRISAEYDARVGYDQPSKVGGRLVDDLDKISEERAKLILDELPPLNQAVRIIDKETSKKIERRDKIIEELKALKSKLEEDAGPIKMADLDQGMTIGDFRKMVKDKDRRRKKLVADMEELGKEGNELEDAINKALYKGLPGLTDAVIHVVVTHIERATALGEVTRRIGEKVMFGDSEAAMEMLKGFEADEVVVSDNVKAEFHKALQKLNLAKKVKRLKS
jgi:hypothetical protein